MELIDIHCHILPGIDDGAADRKTTRKMLALAYQQGVRAVIATPHHSMKFRSDPDEIRELCHVAEKSVRTLYGWEMPVYPGQEIFYNDNVIADLDAGKLLTMADSSYVLVEFLPGAAYSTISNAARNFAVSGYRMILAHAERYSAIHKDAYIEELLHLGVCIQLNARSVGGSWYENRTRWCRKMLKEGKVHFIASDMHNLDRRKPEYGEALRWMQKHLEDGYVDEICCLNALRVRNNERI